MRRLISLCAALGLLCALLAGCGGTPAASSETPAAPAQTAGVTWDALRPEHSMELRYATQFSVDACQGGYKKISIGDGGVYLVVPEGAQVPAGTPEEVTVLQQPLDAIYLAATSAMDLFRELDAIGAIRLSALQASGWYIPEAAQAMEEGRMRYAGKYSAPDYECILEEGCDLAIESTMITHTPEVKEQLERFGVPVLVERSSYEAHPLGRMEWIKLYAALLNREDAAQAYFDALLDNLAPILEQENTGKSVAYFYVTSVGAVNVRKSGDYIAKCVDLAGGVYVPEGIGDGESARSTVNMQMEAFYAQARDADALIYNSAIDAELETLDDLLAKDSVFQNFRAVREGNVWCTGKNLFQETLGLGDLITDIHAILTRDTPEGLELTYLRRLR